MGGKTKKPDLYDVSFDLKFQAKQYEKQSQKLLGSEKQNIKKI